MRRTRLSIGLFLLLSAAACLAGTPASYTGANGNYNVAGSWTTNPIVPINSGPNVYDVSIASKTVTFNIAGTSQINSLSLASATLNLNASDNLTVNNAGTFADSTIKATNSIFSAPLATSADGADFDAETGGQVSIGSLLTVTATSSITDQANSASSKVLLNNLATFNFSTNSITLKATNGGDVELPALATLTNPNARTFSLQSTGTGSLLTLSALPTSLANLNVTAATGGTINWGAPTAATNSTLKLDSSGTLNTSALSNINGTNLTSTNGATFSFAAVTGVTATSGMTFTASNANSKLLLNNLASMDLGTNNISLNASSGGDIELPAFTTLTNSNARTLSLQATGASSVINLPLLGSSAISHVSASVSTGGSINWGAPTFVNSSSITLDTSGTLNIASISNFDSSSATANNGATLTFSSLVTDSANSSDETFSAGGSAGKIQFPTLTTLNFSGQDVTFKAAAGCTVDASALTTLNFSGSETLFLQATGASALVNVPHLTSAAHVNITAATGGTVNLGSITNITNSTLKLDTSGTLNSAAFTDIDNDNIIAANGASFSFPLITSFSVAGNSTSFQATGTGSHLQFPALTTVHENGTSLSVSAAVNCVVDLPNLSVLTYTGSIFEGLDLTATSAGAQINVPSLGSQSRITVNVANGGAVNWGSPASLTQSSLGVQNTSTLNTSALATFDNSSVTVSNGGTLSFPVLTSFLANNFPFNPNFQATNANSHLSFPQLASLSFVGSNLTVTASTGGLIDLPLLATLNYAGKGFEGLNLSATGANSTINVPLLANNPQTLLSVTVGTGGAVNWGSPTTVTASNITQQGGGTLNTATLSNIDNTSITVTGGSQTFNALKVFLASNFIGAPVFESDNSAVLLSMPALTTVNFSGTSLTVNANSGGTFSAPLFSTMNFTGSIFEKLNLSATGTGSSISIPSFAAKPQTNVSVNVASGGAINWGALTVLTNSSITLQTSGTLNTSALTNISSTSLFAKGGASLILPSVTSHMISNFLSFPTFEADDANSLVSLPNLSSFYFNGNALTLRAQGGGKVDLHNLSVITGSGSIFEHLYVDSTGTSSVVDLSSLTDFSVLDNAPFSTSTVDLSANGKVILGGVDQPYFLDFTADFTSLSGSLDLYVNNTLFTSIAPSLLNTNQNFYYSIPSSGDVTFYADGASAAVTLSNYTAFAPVPEPGSAALLMASAVGLVVQRRRRWRPALSSREVLE